jgi:hypothetical protein
MILSLVSIDSEILGLREPGERQMLERLSGLLAVRI